MNRFCSSLCLLCGILCFSLPFAGHGAEGEVLNERVNIRTRPSVASEVIQQLHTGDTVLILDRINLNEPRPGEPKEWFRIQIPDETELWISSQYLDDESSTISASRLNVRAGPGQNFSVVGRIGRGTKVEARRASAGWTAIKPLRETVAYVAAEFVRESSTANADAIIEEEDAEPLAEASNPSPETSPPTASQTTESSDQLAASEDPAPGEEQPNAEPPEIIVDPTDAAPAPDALPPPIVATEPDPSPDSLFDALPEATPATEDRSQPVPAPSIETEQEPSTPDVPPLPESVTDELKRIITRDGIVRRSRNLQAPTYHRLDDPRTGTTINYLYTGKLQVDLGTGPKALKPYEGRRIRVVGVEAVDARWPRIPVIEVEQLRILE